MTKVQKRAIGDERNGLGNENGLQEQVGAEENGMEEKKARGPGVEEIEQKLWGIWEQ